MLLAMFLDLCGTRTVAGLRIGRFCGSLRSNATHLHKGGNAKQRIAGEGTKRKRLESSSNNLAH